MKKRLTYQEPCLRGMGLQDVVGLCRVGSGASGSGSATTQCDAGGLPDSGTSVLCGPGNADANDYANTCNLGKAVSGGTACNVGTGVL